MLELGPPAALAPTMVTPVVTSLAEGPVTFSTRCTTWGAVVEAADTQRGRRNQAAGSINAINVECARCPNGTDDQAGGLVDIRRNVYGACNSLLRLRG